MAYEQISPNMQLIIPGVGLTSGPLYASDINQTLTLIDQHNHAPGYGVPINPAGLSINSDLTFQSNNATNLRTVRFTPQGSPLSLGTDLGVLYEAGVDLYYNDGNGNQIRITQSGSIAGASGSITGLVSPASATYVSATPAFVWQSNTNVAANMDFGAATFRNITPNSTNGVTVQPVANLSSNYTLVLPTLPPGQQIMTLDNSGNISAPYTVDNSTIVIAANVIKVATQGITDNEIALATITGDRIAAATITGSNIASSTVDNSNLITNNINGNKILNSSLDVVNKAQSIPNVFSITASLTTTNTSYTTVVSRTLSLVGGRPVYVQVYTDSDTGGFVSSNPAGATNIQIGSARLVATGTLSNVLPIAPIMSGGVITPASSLSGMYIAPTTGSHTISVEIRNFTPPTTNIASAVSIAMNIIQF